MKTIRQRLVCFSLLAGLGLVISILLYIGYLSAWSVKTSILFALSCLGTLLLVTLWIWECSRLQAARLIIDNQIARLRTAVFRDKALCENSCNGAEESMDVFISHFGVLLGSRIIKFNQGGIQLKAVEMGPDSISLTYGTDCDTKNIRLNSGNFSRRELDDIAERFNFETGVVPVIIDS